MGYTGDWTYVGGSREVQRKSSRNWPAVGGNESPTSYFISFAFGSGGYL